MKEQARQGADRRSRLDRSQTIEPIEKALNGLTNRTDESGKSVARNQSITVCPFSGCEKCQGTALLQGLRPISVYVKPCRRITGHVSEGDDSPECVSQQAGRAVQRRMPLRPGEGTGGRACGQQQHEVSSHNRFILESGFRWSSIKFVFLLKML